MAFNSFTDWVIENQCLQERVMSELEFYIQLEEKIKTENQRPRRSARINEQRIKRDVIHAYEAFLTSLLVENKA